MKMEVSRLVYSAKNGSGSHYIDLTQGLALTNLKNCTQFKDGKPLLVVGTIRLNTANESVRSARPSWAVRNGCVKTEAAWRRTLRSAGIRKKSQLNTYAREMRVAYEKAHALTWGGQLSAGTNVSIIPDNVSNSYGTGVYTSGGDEITVYSYATIGTGTGEVNFSLPKNQYAFTQTIAAVPQSGGTDVLDKKINLLGAVDSTYLNITGEYLDSRINDARIEDTDMDDTPSIDNDLVMMLAPGEEVADDVLDNINDEGRWRPYDLATANSEMKIIVPNANVAGQDTPFEAPLGLLKWQPSGTGSKLIVDVIAIMEM